VELARKRVIIEGVAPEIDGGLFPVKRTVGDRLRVEADIVADGHEVLAAELLHRREAEPDWRTVPLRLLVNDRWRGEFTVSELGRYHYTIQAWIDRFRTWQRDLQKKVEAGQDVAVELLMGAELVEEAQSRAERRDAEALGEWAEALRQPGEQVDWVEKALDPELTLVMGRYPDRRFITVYDKTLTVVVDPVKARYSTWYEMFPRSSAPEPSRHGTFQDCELRLPYIAHLGFDVLYLPPIHPIGRTHRKGKNNVPRCTPEDVGSPWAIGSVEGGHKAVHPDLGTLEDLRRLAARAKEYGIDIALDIAFQGLPGPPLRQRTPPMVPLAPGQHRAVRRKSPQEIRGYLPL